VMSIAAARATRLTSHSTKHRFIDPSLPPYLQESISSETGNATTPTGSLSRADAPI
jgi:hypothetical protein